MKLRSGRIISLDMEKQPRRVVTEEPRQERVEQVQEPVPEHVDDCQKILHDARLCLEHTELFREDFARFAMNQEYEVLMADNNLCFHLNEEIEPNRRVTHYEFSILTSFQYLLKVVRNLYCFYVQIQGGHTVYRNHFMNLHHRFGLLQDTFLEIINKYSLMYTTPRERNPSYACFIEPNLAQDVPLVQLKGWLVLKDAIKYVEYVIRIFDDYSKCKKI